MTLREVLNLWTFVLLLVAGLACFDLLNDLVKHQPLDYYETLFPAAGLAPALLMLITGQAYGIAFFSGLLWNEAGAAQNHYSRERALARAGKGREAAQGMLWRDRVVGDTPALFAVLEMALLDPGMQREALRSMHRLASSGRLSSGDRDHLKRLLSQLDLSGSKGAAAGKH